MTPPRMSPRTGDFENPDMRASQKWDLLAWYDIKDARWWLLENSLRNDCLAFPTHRPFLGHFCHFLLFHGRSFISRNIFSTYRFLPFGLNRIPSLATLAYVAFWQSSGTLSPSPVQRHRFTEPLSDDDWMASTTTRRTTDSLFTNKNYSF